MLYEASRAISDPKQYLNRYQLLIIPILFSASIFVFRADDFVRTLNFLFLMVSIPGYIILTANPKFFQKYSTLELFSMLGVITMTENIFAPIKSWLKSVTGNKLDGRLSGVLIKVAFALAITLPAFIIILTILASGDQIFSHYTNDILNSIWTNLFNIPDFFKLAFSTICAFIIWIYLAGIVSKKNTLVAQSSEIVNRTFHELIIPSIFIYAINLIYLGFIIVQFGYLFGGENFTRQYNIVFSEYAIKGFWEMLTVIVINYFVLYFLQTKFSLKAMAAKLMLIPAYVFTIFASIVMVISSLNRIMVYINGYGYTRDRLTPLSFLIFVTAVLILLFTSIFLADSARKKVIKVGTFVIATLFLMAFSIFNMDSFIVRNDIGRKNPDYKYMFEETGLEGKLELFNYRGGNCDCDLSTEQFDILMRKAVYLGRLGYPNSWQGTNIPEMLIRTKYIETYKVEPEKGKDYYGELYGSL
jgi:hypothetical protein